MSEARAQLQAEALEVAREVAVRHGWRSRPALEGLAASRRTVALRLPPGAAAEARGEAFLLLLLAEVGPGQAFRAACEQLLPGAGHWGRDSLGGEKGRYFFWTSETVDAPEQEARDLLRLLQQLPLALERLGLCYEALLRPPRLTASSPLGLWSAVAVQEAVAEETLEAVGGARASVGAAQEALEEALSKLSRSA